MYSVIGRVVIWHDIEIEIRDVMYLYILLFIVEISSAFVIIGDMTIIPIMAENERINPIELILLGLSRRRISAVNNKIGRAHV